HQPNVIVASSRARCGEPAETVQSSGLENGILLMSIAGWEGTGFAAQWGPAGGLRCELGEVRISDTERYGTGLPIRWQRLMVA
ncbi:MAG: hypothetical protein ABGZ35_09435, partial [Planctomycetaceae bacterium]